MNLYEKINEVRKVVGYIQKDKKVSTGSGTYTAVSHDSVTAILRQHMIEQGIICVPNLIKSCAHPKEEGAKQARYDATYSFEFINASEPADRLSIVIEAHAMDNGDKAPGKALSYAKKYALLKLFELESGDDDEGRYPDNENDDDLTGVINEEQIDDILRLFTSSGAKTAGFCKYFKINKLEELPASRYKDAMALLRSKEKQRIAEAAKTDNT